MFVICPTCHNAFEGSDTAVGISCQTCGTVFDLELAAVAPVPDPAPQKADPPAGPFAFKLRRPSGRRPDSSNGVLRFFGAFGLIGCVVPLGCLGMIIALAFVREFFGGRPTAPPPAIAYPAARWVAPVTDKTVTGVAFSSNSKTLAVAYGEQIRLWDVQALAPWATLSGHTGPVLALAFSPDGRTLASGGEEQDTTIRLWDVGTHKERGRKQIRTRPVWALAFSPDGRTLAAGDSGAIHLWDAVTFDERATFDWGWVEKASVTFSPDGKAVQWITGEQFQVKVVRWEWGVSSPKTVLRINHHQPDPKQGGKVKDVGDQVHFPALSTDGKMLAGCTHFKLRVDGKMLAEDTHTDVTLWDVRAGEKKCSRSIAGLFASSEETGAIAFSPDDGTIAVGSGEHEKDIGVALFDTGLSLRSKLRGRGIGRVDSLVFSPDGLNLAAISGESVVLWQGQRLLPQDGVLFDPEGKRLP